jgi:hypothetical protein
MENDANSESYSMLHHIKYMIVLPSLYELLDFSTASSSLNSAYRLMLLGPMASGTAFTCCGLNNPV